MIARAVVEQLQEERKDEIASLRATIYSDVKVLVLLPMFDLLVDVSDRFHAATLRNLPENMLEGDRYLARHELGTGQPDLSSMKHGHVCSS